jgi:hypothetical protein
MAALIGALDSYTSTQIGENGHTEYTWSNSIKERILQLSFQLTRTKDISVLSKQIDSLLIELQARKHSSNLDNKEYNEMSYINFASRNASGIVNNASVGSGVEPTYQEGRIESGSFTISAGPIPGSYKLNWEKEYIIVAPVNSGNSLYMIDSGSGMTGTCQKI